MNAHLPVSFLRATPPALNELGTGVRSALASAVLACDDRAELFRQHRFDGTSADKEAAADWLSQRLAPRPPLDRVLVTNGTMNSLLLLFATLVGPRNVLATEELTFPQVKTIAALFDIRVVGVELDHEGLMPASFEALCTSSAKPKVLYCNPTIQSPTTAVMPIARRKEIAELARRHGVLIIEDEAQALYAERPPPPIASFAPEITWYLMGLSKYLSLGIRAAFVVAPGDAQAQAVLTRVRTLSTWHAAPVIAALVSSWMNDGAARRIFAAARREIHERQALVRETLHDLPEFRGSQGLHFWLGAPPGCSAERFVAAANAAGVLVRSSDLYSVVGKPAWAGIRPAIGDPTREDLQRGLRILRSVYEELTHAQS